MPRGHFHLVVRIEYLSERSHVDVAEPLNLLHRQAFADQLLLHLGDFRGSDIPHRLGEFHPGFLEIAAIVEPFDDLLEQVHALGLVRRLLGSEIAEVNQLFCLALDFL